MESASSRNTPDIQALRDEYAHLAFELQRGPIKMVSKESSEAAIGIKAKIAGLLENISSFFTSEDEIAKKAQLDDKIATAEKILVFAQKPELAEESKDWKRYIELMILARRRITIFKQEAELADRAMKRATGRYSATDGLKAHQKLVAAEGEVKNNIQSFIDVAQELFEKIGIALEKTQY